LSTAGGALDAEGSAPRDRVVGQAFLDCGFSVFGEQGLEKKAEARAHRFES